MAIKSRVASAASSAATTATTAASAGAKSQGTKGPQLNMDFMKIWKTAREYIPEILLDPIKLMSRILKYTNMVFS